jgi:hypothetical protein
MEFCSSHVYLYSDSENEIVSNDECENDFEKINFQNELYLNNDCNRTNKSSIETDNDLFNVTTETTLSSINGESRISGFNEISNTRMLDSQYRFSVPKAMSTINQQK